MLTHDKAYFINVLFVYYESMNGHPVCSTLREPMHSISLLERQTSHCIKIFSYESHVTLKRAGPNVSS